MKYNQSYRHALLIQRLIVEDCQKPDVTPSVRALLARAFCEIIECKRRLLGKPLPKAVDYEKLRALRERVIEASSSAVSAEEPEQLPDSQPPETPANTDN